MSYSDIFGNDNFERSIAGYLGLIRTVKSKVQKRQRQDFKSAIQNLEYAKTSSDESNRMDYLRTAKSKFIDAINVEENENLISAYVGLAMCQHLLKDEVNVEKTMKRIKDIKLSLSQKAMALAIDYSPLGYFRNIFLNSKVMVDPPLVHSEYNIRVANFEEYKQKVLATYKWK